MFEKEREYYNAHKNEFLKKYEGMWLVFFGRCLDTAFSTPEAGYLYAAAKYGEGNFMLHHCVENECVIINRAVFGDERAAEGKLL